MLKSIEVVNLGHDVVVIPYIVSYKLEKYWQYLGKHSVCRKYTSFQY